MTNLSLRFLTVDCVVGGVAISCLSNSGTFTCPVPLNIQMYWIQESVLFSSCLSVVPGTEDSGTPASLAAFMKSVMFLIQRRSS